MGCAFFLPKRRRALRDFSFSCISLLQHLRSQGRILDHGCGYGRLLDQLSGAGYGNAVGMDFSGKMLMRLPFGVPSLDAHLNRQANAVLP